MKKIKIKNYTIDQIDFVENPQVFFYIENPHKRALTLERKLINKFSPDFLLTSDLKEYTFDFFNRQIFADYIYDEETLKSKDEIEKKYLELSRTHEITPPKFLDIMPQNMNTSDLQNSDICILDAIYQNYPVFFAHLHDEKLFKAVVGCSIPFLESGIYKEMGETGVHMYSNKIIDVLAQKIGKYLPQTIKPLLVFSYEPIDTENLLLTFDKCKIPLSIIKQSEE